MEGSPLHIHGVAEITIALAGRAVRGDFIVADSLQAQAILGLDFLERNGCVINTNQKVLQGVAIPLQGSRGKPQVALVKLGDTVRVPASSELELTVCTPQPLDRGTWLLEGVHGEKVPFVVAGAVVSTATMEGTTHVPVRLLNPSAEVVTLHHDTKVAQLEPLESEAISGVSEEAQREQHQLTCPQ